MTAQGRPDGCGWTSTGSGIEYEVTGEGRPVVLLHGFPDSGRLWRHQVPALAEAGFQVIVPDLRGYGRSGKPEAVEAYSLLTLAGDVMAVLADVGVDRAHVVGHDWGAALAWGLASLAPDTVDHLAVLSVGHPATFRRTYKQCEKSWYMLLFQFPGIAERWLTDDDWANFRNLGRSPRYRPGDRRPGVGRIAHARPELVPGQRPAGIVGWAAADAAAGASPHYGRLEHGRRRPDRDADDRFGRERVRSMAL